MTLGKIELEEAAGAGLAMTLGEEELGAAADERDGVPEGAAAGWEALIVAEAGGRAPGSERAERLL